ncbi:hypothetical protein PGT21_018660 [Puccinia graminis f. sp. tritici]|uniref:C2H2-type domain-containing protein n=1 Tax=Puccinia graminis f. sp. tritici TaxID=56615 RepID=A0A5B0NR03_PUCGR|nr:hypothetical protein PGT21_018660 [Puccinia graminis f. sp. tritici]KAA1125518.1 hypothetical protein PGTUg99_012636 [Puccinia graminis f. sp. tritici]
MVHKTGVHKCPECPKTFSRLEYVTRHRRVKHLGARPWSCQCGVSYARSDLLTRHKRKCSQAKESIGASSKYNLDDPSTSSVVTSVNHSGIIKACDHSSDDNQPPTYQQAISDQAPFTANTNHPADYLAQASSFRADLARDTRVSLSRPDGLITQEADNFGPGTTLRQFGLNCTGEEGLSSLVPPDDQEFYDVARENTNQREIENIPEVSSDVGTSIVPLVRFSDPSFLISDVPQSSPFYLNPSIWILAFLCQKSQGFTIPHMGSLSAYLSRATEVMCPVIPMFHVPTLRATQISIHLGYALSVSGAALESSEHALAFTDQSLSYKRISVQNDFLRRDRSFTFRFELLQSLLTYQFLGMFSRLEVQRQRAIRFSPTIVQNFRELAFIETLRNSPDYVQLALSGQVPLEVAWKLWVEYEVQKRTAFLVLISALQLRGPYESGLRLSETNLPLPCHEEIWTARSSEEWAQAARKHAMCCWLDNMQTSESFVDRTNIQQVVGEQSIPLLSEALAALHISDSTSQINQSIPDIHRVGASRLTVRAERLGCFAKTVIHHARALTHQATVSIHLLEPPPLNI